jgi:hypothetical protein
VFDPALLAHRLDDVCDWWASPSEEIAEVNAGNALFVGLLADGLYTAEVSFGNPPPRAQPVVALITTRSGSVFVGPGEQTTGEGLEPAIDYGGVFLPLAPGTYRVAVTWAGPNRVAVYVSASDSPARNSFSDCLRLPEQPSLS